MKYEEIGIASGLADRDSPSRLQHVLDGKTEYGERRTRSCSSRLSGVPEAYKYDGTIPRSSGG